MNKIIIIIIAILVVGGGIFLAIKGNNNEYKSDGPEEGIEVFVGRVADLVKQGKSISCTFKTDNEFGNIEGTVFVSNENVRGNFDLTDEEGVEFESHFIRLEDTVYTWGSTPLGEIAIKTSINEDNEAEGVESETETNTNFDQDEEVEYSCKTWKSDPAVFLPPNDVEFFDLTLGKSDSQCFVCNNVEDETARRECLESLNCL